MKKALLIKKRVIRMTEFYDLPLRIKRFFHRVLRQLTFSRKKTI